MALWGNDPSRIRAPPMWQTDRKPRQGCDTAMSQSDHWQEHAVARMRALTDPRDRARRSDSEKAQDDLPRSSYDRFAGRSARQAGFPRHGVYWLRVLKNLQRSFAIALLPAPLVAQL